MNASSSDGLINVKCTLNLDRIPYEFTWYKDNNTSSIKIKPTKKSESYAISSQLSRFYGKKLS